MATQIFEAVVDENGVLQFTEPFRFPHGTKALVTIIEADTEPEQAEFDVILNSRGDKRIPSVRVVRDGDFDRSAKTFEPMDDEQTEFALPEIKPSEVKAVVALVYGIRSSRNNHTPEGYAATLGYYESAARLAPRLGAAHFLLGKTLEYKRRYTEARTAFEAAVRDSGNESVQRLATKSLADLPKESVPTP